MEAILASVLISGAGGVFLEPGFRVDEAISVQENAVAFVELPDRRILTISHRDATVEIIANGVAADGAIFTVPEVLVSNEQGLLGIAVDPDWPAENWIYLFYTHETPVNRVSRFRATGDLDDGDSLNLGIDGSSEEILIEGPSTQVFHNGGTLRFGSDKTLYISHGDDALSRGNVQNLTVLHGKMLRINRDGSIPPDNPVFPDAPVDARGEIFAIGLRNPFRFAIDPQTDALLIADVGGDLVEEISYAEGGENFGYPFYEGSAVFRDKTELLKPAPTFPVFEYAHPDFGSQSVVVLSGYGPLAESSPDEFPVQYHGTWFWADYFVGDLMHLRQEGAGWVSERIGEGFARAADGAPARDGGVWILRYGHSLSRIVNDGLVPVLDLGLHAAITPDGVRLEWRRATDERYVIQRGGEAHLLRDLDQSREAVFVDDGITPGTWHYRVVAMGPHGEARRSEVVSVTLPAMAGVGPPDPNPFSAGTRIPVFTASATAVVEIYDVAGRRVRRLPIPPRGGRVDVPWDGRDDVGQPVADGVYFARLSSDPGGGTRMVVQR